ncbi:MAG: tetraacyldisaccharide 4'-kinase [Steroidobacteraceae bacterium]
MATRLHDWLLETWYGDDRRGRWLRPAAWLFAGISRLRRASYVRGLLPRYRSRRPVVVVGNLTVGGTGKTPFVSWLARELAHRGLRPGIAMRGYGGAGGHARLLTSADTAATAGDEPLLLQRKLQIPIAIGARRADAARLLEDHCDVIVCDDGLQHYGLARDIEIAVVDGSRQFGNGRMLPAGPLREPVSRLGEMDAVVVNGHGFDWPSAIRMRLEPVAVVALRDGSRRPLTDFSGRQVTALAAIGNPGRFFSLLREHGVLVEERVLPDHGRFTLEAAGAGEGRAILMTEKDAVKCAGDGWNDAGYVEVEARVDAAAAAGLLARIEAMAAHRQGSHRE